MWRGIFSYLCRYWGNSQILSTSFIYLLIHSFSTTYEDTDSMLRNRNRKLPTNSPKASFFWTIRICLIFKLTAFKNQHAAAAAAKSLQSCPTLCNPIDGSPPGSPIPRILQARTLEWVAISFSNAWKWKVKGKSLSRVRLFAIPWTAAYQAPLSMGFPRQEYWSGLPLPSPKISIVFINIQIFVFF